MISILHQQNNMDTTCSMDRKDKKDTQNFSQKTQRAETTSETWVQMRCPFHLTLMCYIMGLAFSAYSYCTRDFCTLYYATSKRDKTIFNFTMLYYVRIIKELSWSWKQDAIM
jgi:hypothetical protein